MEIVEATGCRNILVSLRMMVVIFYSVVLYLIGHWLGAGEQANQDIKFWCCNSIGNWMCS